MHIFSRLFIGLAIVAAFTLSSCNDSTSYADLLQLETKAINNFLADQIVVGNVPADNNFAIGNDAPYYRMDEDGNVYMQVIDKGDMDERFEDNELVYIRMTRYDLSEYKDSELPYPSYSNEGNVSTSISIRYNNYTSSSSIEWGEGIQLPLGYFGNQCEVNIVVRSIAGRNDEIAVVTPYLYHIRYYKSNI